MQHCQNEGLLSFEDLKLFRAREYEADEGPTDPISGGATAIVGTMSTMMMGVADMPIETLKALKIHPDAAKKQKKTEKSEAAAEAEAAMSAENSKGKQVESPQESSSREPSSCTSSRYQRDGAPQIAHANRPWQAARKT